MWDEEHSRALRSCRSQGPGHICLKGLAHGCPQADFEKVEQEPKGKGDGRRSWAGQSYVRHVRRRAGELSGVAGVKYVESNKKKFINHF